MGKRKPILCLDFDGVCHQYTSGWQGVTVIPDDAVPGLFEFLERVMPVFDVQVFSSRSRTDEGIGAMQVWFVEQRKKWRQTIDPDIPLQRLNITFPRTKPPAHITIDDRAITFNGTWPNVDLLLAFRPWNRGNTVV